MGGTTWGIVDILICIQPIAGIVSAAMKKAEWLPVILMIIGSILSGIGWSASMSDMLNNMPR